MKHFKKYTSAIRKWVRNRGLDKHRCKERGTYDANSPFKHDDGPMPDTWDKRPNGDRCCSYCGSLHPEDMAALVKKCITSQAKDVQIELTTKSYKVYVNQRGINHAGEGGIKFYMWHVSPELLTTESQAEYAEAVKLSRAAFAERMKPQEEGIQK